MYIVFEWVAGAGKTTQSKKLIEFLNKRFPEKEILLVREPGGTPITDDIRHLAQAKRWENDYMHPLTNAYLYAAARAQLIHMTIIPALTEGKIVISDRSFLSSLAYQGEAQKLGFDKVMSINSDAILDCYPDLVLYFDIDIDTAMKRVFDEKWDKWESMGRQFYMDIAEGYNKCEKLGILENRFMRINANRSEEEIFDEISAIISEKIENI